MTDSITHATIPSTSKLPENDIAVWVRINPGDIEATLAMARAELAPLSHSDRGRVIRWLMSEWEDYED